MLFKPVIGFGLPIAFCFHQLYLLKRDKETGMPGPAGEPQPVSAAELLPLIANQDEPQQERKAA